MADSPPGAELVGHDPVGCPLQGTEVVIILSSAGLDHPSVPRSVCHRRLSLRVYGIHGAHARSFGFLTAGIVFARHESRGPGRPGAEAIRCATMCVKCPVHPLLLPGLVSGSCASNLSVYLRRINRGERFEVTDRGTAVALLLPLPSTLRWSAWSPKAGLVRRRGTRWICLLPTGRPRRPSVRP